MKNTLVIVALALVAGCSTTPSSIVQGPTSSRPMLVQAAPANDGAIYNANSYRPMFEDRRARHIGDLLTINITERTSAGKSGATTGSKSGSASFTVPGPLQAKLGAGVGLEGANKFADADTQSASNNFTGTIGVTVTEVLANGNLIVAGEKQVAMNKGIEYIRFSGMVAPDTIQPGNMVSSTVIADARVEYRTNSRVDKAEMSNMLSRFFQSVLPF
ncbi:flagellar basal body L-ring protein FlgH [Massilia yuzhufengensis]|uniref:Flagellar L-ring protein n=1 Tax=Massilia yuzhufengensis TaxID=1164594 RepID=A0A1I1MJB5_9BURK|nr:flagellar basal body L-ring protein FlgH [Massilia yuzhufengensis]SFC85487.1 flagellar L-ring protein precursor FlgH [Massilia yuzhufengensis]